MAGAVGGATPGGAVLLVGAGGWPGVPAFAGDVAGGVALFAGDFGGAPGGVTGVTIGGDAGFFRTSEFGGATPGGTVPFVGAGD